MEEFRSNKNDAYSGTISVAATFKAEKEQDLNKGQSPSASVNRDRDTLRTMDSTEEPTTVLIDDEPLDINGTGIDVEYLEDPPPDNFREEIVRQHVHNQPEPNPEALERIRKIGQKRPLSHTTEPQGKFRYFFFKTLSFFIKHIFFVYFFFMIGSSGKKRKIDVSETKDVLYQKQSVESWRCFK